MIGRRKDSLSVWRWLWLAVALGFGLQAASAWAQPVKASLPEQNILVIFSYGEDVSAYGDIAAGIKAAVVDAGGNSGQLFF